MEGFLVMTWAWLVLCIQSRPISFSIQGKTVQVIAFLAAIMRKRNDKRDAGRRRKHVSALQDKQEWRDGNRLPRADATWPTALIVAPSTVVHNWQREIQTVSIWQLDFVGTILSTCRSGDILKSASSRVPQNTGLRCSRSFASGVWTYVSLSRYT